MSNYDSYYELIVDRFLSVLGIEHLSYTLIHAKINIYGKDYITWLSASEDFKQPGESKIALDVYYQLERRKEESPLEFCIRMGLENILSKEHRDKIWEMLQKRWEYYEDFCNQR